MRLHRPELTAFTLSFTFAALVGCIDFSGALCASTANCPEGQYCAGGSCVKGVDPGLGECASCATGSCAYGLTCRQRACDGAKACVKNDGSSTCAKVGTASCPKVSYFGACSTSSDCATDADCIDGRCLQKCTTGNDCFLLAPGASAVTSASCVSYDTYGQRCYPGCTASLDSACQPFASWCSTYSNGTYGYCEIGCSTCTTNADCSNGYACSRRLCDGVKGCYPPDAGGCSQIGYGKCPSVFNGEVCTSQGDCGAVSTCRAYPPTGTTTRCMQDCTTDNDCSIAYVAGVKFNTLCVAPDCAPRCLADGGCPDGLACTGVLAGKPYCK